MNGQDFTFQTDDGASLHVTGWAVNAPKAVLEREVIRHGVKPHDDIKRILDQLPERPRDWWREQQKLGEEPAEIEGGNLISVKGLPDVSGPRAGEATHYSVSTLSEDKGSKRDVQTTSQAPLNNADLKSLQDRGGRNDE